jgi:hypothetical protein
MFTPVELTSMSSNWPEIQQDLAHFGATICNAAEECLVEYSHTNRRLDRLSIRIRPDCGTIYIALVGAKTIYREVCSVKVPQLEIDYYEFSRTYGADEQGFLREHARLVNRVRDMLVQLLSFPESAQCLIQLCSLRGIRVGIMEYEDEETEQEFTPA